MSRDTFTFDNLIAGNFPLATDRGTIISGQNLARGTLLGKHTSGGSAGKLRIIDSDGTTGTQTPYAILADDCDASLGDKVATIYLTGQFNINEVLVDSNDTAASFKDACKAISIFLVESQQEVA